jgi:hypothetical protein
VTAHLGIARRGSEKCKQANRIDGGGGGLTGKNNRTCRKSPAGCVDSPHITLRTTPSAAAGSRLYVCTRWSANPRPRGEPVVSGPANLEHGDPHIDEGMVHLSSVHERHHLRNQWIAVCVWPRGSVRVVQSCATWAVIVVMGFNLTTQEQRAGSWLCMFPYLELLIRHRSYHACSNVVE